MVVVSLWWVRRNMTGMSAWRRLVVTPLVLSLVSVLFWAIVRPPISSTPWPGVASGFAVAPFASGQDPARADEPDPASLVRDVQLLARVTGRIRTYSLDGVHARVPELAAAHGLSVTAGVPVHADAAANANELQRLQSAVLHAGSLERVLIGNEALLRGDVTPAQLMSVLDRARRALDVPVSTAEPWHVWLRHPYLAAHVDFITVHLLPYWEGIPVEHAIGFVAQRLAELREAFPDKRLVIGEVGWPSRGRDRGGARATPGNQARFLAQFMQYAALHGHDYFLMEAFDQPWKRRGEGEAGAYWGIHDAHRHLKATLRGGPWWSPRNILGSLVPGLATALLALLAWSVLRVDSSRLTWPGHWFLAAGGWLAAMATVALTVSRSGQYWTASMVVGGVIVALLFLGAMLVWLAECHEWAEARWARREPWQPPVPWADLPAVSLHLPICNEPPKLVLDTLESLARLDYPDLEVLVVDNNTRDEAVWRPVQDACARLGERFRFFHEDQLEGFKAGALNLALTHTSPSAAVIAVLDADYQVSPHWLRRLVPYFRDGQVDIVQAPQDYRDGADSTFKSFCHSEYKGFFHIGMPVRDARNAIITHGTMTLLRRDALEAAGGWSPLSITEDAELGLRVLARGGEARYVPESHGRGLTPDNFLDYKGQRFRWALGAVHILREHVDLLSGRKPCSLSPGQRYHFLAGWLPWLADGASLVLCLSVLLWSVMMCVAPHIAAPPLALVSMVPVALLAARIAKQVHLYRSRIRATWVDALGGALAGMALMPTVGVAVLLGVVGAQRDFLRTPKLACRHSVAGAIRAARWEGSMAVALITFSVVLASIPAPHSDMLAWRTLLLTMSLPYLCAVCVSLSSALPGSRRSVYRDLPVANVAQGIPDSSGRKY